MAAALAEVGWQVLPILGRSAAPAEVAEAAAGVDLVLIATPDAAVAEVAAAIGPVTTAAVAHLAGSLGLGAVAPHPRPAALHPLAALPDATVGARRLLAGCWFAVAGDPLVRQVVADLGGRALEVADADRAAYHAAAVVAISCWEPSGGSARPGRAHRLDGRGPLCRPRRPCPGHCRERRRVGTGRRSDRSRGPRRRRDDPAPGGRRCRTATAAVAHLAIAPSERAAYEALAQQARRLAGREESS